MGKSIRIYLPIKERLLYDLLASQLKKETFQVVGKHRHNYRLPEELSRWKPDVVLLYLSKITGPTPESIQLLSSQEHESKFASISTPGAIARLPEMINTGIRGIIHQNDGKDTLMECVETVADGRHYISSKVTRTFLYESDSDYKKATSAWLHKLTKREIEILKKIVQFHSNQAMADEFNVSYKTVKNHRHNMCEKLKLSGRGALLRFALEHKEELLDL